MSKTRLTRREFVRVGGTAVGAVALGGGAAVLGACGGKNKYPELPMVEDRLVINLEDHPTLKEVNQGILFQVPNNDENIVVVHTEEGYAASGAMCPHKGCSVRWNADTKLLECPCHKAAYEADGTCVRGPGWSDPPSCEEWGKRLTRYDAVEENGTIVVTLAE